MVVLPILNKNSKQRACLGNKNLPANYMSDFSVMALVVGRLDAALRVLKEKKFEIQEKAEGFEITMEGASRMTEIVSLLQQNNIDYVMADIVDQVYQG